MCLWEGVHPNWPRSICRKSVGGVRGRCEGDVASEVIQRAHQSCVTGKGIGMGGAMLRMGRGAVEKGSGLPTQTCARSKTLSPPVYPPTQVRAPRSLLLHDPSPQLTSGVCSKTLRPARAPTSWSRA